MIHRERVFFWLSITAMVILLLVVLNNILLPFVAGMAIAYFLDPVADRLEKVGSPRWLAATVVLVGFALLAIALMLLLVPMVDAQVKSLVTQLPKYASSIEDTAADWLGRIESNLSPEEAQRLQEALRSNVGRVVGVFGQVLDSVLVSGLAFFNFVTLVFVTPIVAFYLLRDWDRMVARIDTLLPRARRSVVRQQALEIDRTLSGFVRGQALVCITLGTFYAVGLTLAGLKFGLIVGLIAGLISFVPYVGSIVGLVLSIGLAAVQFDDPWRIVICAVIFFVGQAIEGNVLQPIMVGDRVGLHPVWVIFALFAFGALFGFVGLLLAVPAAAVIGVLVRFAVEQYRSSELYETDAESEATESPEPN